MVLFIQAHKLSLLLFVCWFLVLSPYLWRAWRQQAFVGQTDEVAHLLVVAHVLHVDFHVDFYLYLAHDFVC